MKIIAKNKRASFDYFLEQRYEAGIELKGTEVKSIREEKCHITESHVTIDSRSEVWINNMYIPPYEFGNQHNHQERRKRKLLLNRKEITEMQYKINAGGYVLVPTILYFKKGRVKIEIALGKGKKIHDKRQAEAKKAAEKKIRRGEYS